MSGRNGGAAESQAVVLGARARIPEHVVYRSFAREVVVLNLETGRYHGLNSSAGRMLEALEREERVRDAVALLAGEYSVDETEIERDVYEFCTDLAARGLIELEPNGRH